LEKLRAQQKEVQNVFAAARSRLPSLAQGAEYPELLGKLIMQGLVSLDEKDIVVRVRVEDVELAQKLVPGLIEEFKTKWLSDKARKFSVTVDTQHHVKCSGGAVISALEGRIICNNTLDMRLVYAYEVSLPRLRHTLFGQTSI
jgi:V-type H+-transporting ATPase subunit E